MKICLKCIHTQAIKYVDEFVPSSEQIWRILHYISVSPMDPQQWMGAVIMRVQTADKNTTSNPHLLQSSQSCGSKICW